MSFNIRTSMAFATRIGSTTREHEILRIAGRLPHTSSAVPAIDEILKWAQKRCGGTLPQEAWDHSKFDYLAGGRNSMAARFEDADHDIWSIRAEDPDKLVPGRIWTTEVAIGGVKTELPRFSARLLATTTEDELAVQPHAPGFAQQIIKNVGLVFGSKAAEPDPEFVDTEADLNAFVQTLLDPYRQLPVLALSCRSGQTLPLIDADALTAAVFGLAHVYVLSSQATWRLGEELGKQRSVFAGGIRCYLPGFDLASSPFAHRLVIGENLTTDEQKLKAQYWFRSIVADYSIAHLRLGKEIVSFSAVRSAQSQLERNASLVSGIQNDPAEREATTQLIQSLTDQVKDLAAQNEYFDKEHAAAIKRAEEAEQQAATSAYIIQTLRDALRERGVSTDDDIIWPTEWAALGDWVDQNLTGRLVLNSTARKMIRKPIFEDVEATAQCLLWLATTCRDRRIDGGDGSLREAEVLNGIRNAHCGSDEYETVWQGRKYTVDWHIKNGGNVRAPERCLRIYYFWDETTQQIVVDELPAHRRTGAT